MQEENDKKVRKSLKYRKYQMLELVEVDVDDDDFDGDVDARKKVSKRSKSPADCWFIVDLRDGNVLDRITSKDKRIFFAACKDDEKKHFVALRRKIRRKDGEVRYTMFHRLSGRRVEDVDAVALQTFVAAINTRQVAGMWRIEELREDEPLESFEAPRRAPRVSGNVKSHRPEDRNQAIGFDKDVPSSDITLAPSAMPELDTVRVFFPCASLIDIDSFMPLTSNKEVYLCDRGVDGSINREKTLFRTEFTCSWYGKMQITRELRRWGRNGVNAETVLCFEYSVAKWYNFTNGINTGIEPCAEHMLYPCIQAIYAYDLAAYAWNDRVTNEYVADYFMRVVELRRFDLSKNFKAPSALYKARDYVNLVSRCRLNRQDSKCEDRENPVKGSISWGTEKSPYRVIMYDKEAEQKRYFSMKDGRKPLVYFEDKDGKMYPRQNPEGTLTEKVYDFDLKRKNFYAANKDKFENVFRYEVQFNTKFIQEHHLMSTGRDNIDNVLRMGEVYWRDILNRFDEQLGRNNFDVSKEREGLAKALDKLRVMRDDEVISRTVYSNMTLFIMECLYRGWDAIWRELGKDNFSKKYRWCLKELNYDVKIKSVAQANEVPIMRVMPTVVLGRERDIMDTFRFVPAPEYRIASGE